MTAEIVPPITVDGGGVFQVLPAVDLACQAVEVEDVHLVEVFDSTGRRLMFVPDRLTVNLEVLPDSDPEPAELERRLRNSGLLIGSGRTAVDDLEDAPAPVIRAHRLQRGDYDQRRRSFFRRRKRD